MPPKQYDLEERLLEFSVRIIDVVDELPNSRVGEHGAGQLLGCRTSPFPDRGEAQAAESRRDFVHKIKIALKELRETHRWLRFVQRVSLVRPAERLRGIVTETEELTRIFAVSARTAERSRRDARL